MKPEPLSLAPEELRRLGHRAVDLVVDHLAALRDGPPVRTGTPEELAALLHEAPPEEPGDLDAALELLARDVLPFMQHGDHPRFFARVPSPSNPVSLLGDVLASGTNAIAASWGGGSGPAAVELVVLDWLRTLLGLPDGTEGILLSGGSVSSLTALATARHALHGGHDPAATVYVSDQTHSSILRGLRVLGFARDRVRVLETDGAFRLPADAVAQAIAGDRAAGLRPLCVVATAGTTNTGAVDPLNALADIARAEGLWLHVDGAYGAPAALTPDGRALLDGLHRADSLAVDPHKWLFQPYECGALLVRRPGALQAAFTMAPEYLRDTAGSRPLEVDFRDRGPQLSRGSRALKLWLSLKAYGVGAFRDAIARGVALAEHAERVLEAHDAFQVVTPAQLAIVTFRRSDLDDEGHVELARRAVADGFAAPSSTELRGRTVLRLCIINPRTTEADLDEAITRLGRL